MVIKKLVLSYLATNCYFLINNGLCVVIDPACNSEKILEFAKNNNLKIEAVLLTHGHFDHCSACKKLQEQGIKIYVSIEESIILKEHARLMGLTKDNFFEPDFCFVDGEILNLAGLKIKAIKTNGHSEGSYSFLIDDCLFCGDTMFAGGDYGRCDLYSGSFEKIKYSIKEKLFKLDDKTKVYPGHGQDFLLGDYKKELVDF